MRRIVRRVRFVCEQQLGVVFGQPLREVPLCDEHLDPRVLNHVRQALRRVGRVERHVSAAGFEDCQHGHDHLGRALKVYAHVRARLDTFLPQSPSQCIGPAVQFRVAQLLLLGFNGDRLRRASRLPLEHLVDVGGRGSLGLGSVPLDERRPPLVFAHQWQFADASPRVCCDAFEEPRVVAGHAPDGLRLEEVCVVEQDAGQLAWPLLEHHERQVELGGLLRQRERAQSQAGQPDHPARHVLQGEHDLEKRRVRKAALRL